MPASFAVATRPYSIACAVLVLLMFPGFVASFGVVRQHPLDRSARPDIVAVSFGGGAWMPSRGIAAARLIDGIPAGMRICYRLASGNVRCGEVRNVAQHPAQTAARTVIAILALAFVLAGAVLALIGADRRALAAAGMLAGIGLLFGADFLEPALVTIGDLSMQLAVIAVWEWFPRYAGLICMLVFAREFPATLPRSRSTIALVAIVTALVISATVIEGVAHVPGLLERTSLRIQGAVVSLILLNQKLVYAGAALGVIVLAIRQRKHAASRPAQLRRSARVVAAALVFGFVPPMTLGLLQVIFGLALGRRPIPFPLMSASFLTLLAVPAAVMVAVMARRVDSARIQARRVLLFTLADRVLPPIIKVVPLAAIAVLLYVNRHRSIQSLVEEHPIALLAMGVAAGLLFGFGERMRRAVQTYFFRNAAATRERLGALPSLVARKQTVDAVARVLERELDAAFHPEAVAVFLRDEREQAFRTVTVDLPRVSGTSAIAAALEEARLPLPASAVFERKDVAEVDRHWIAVTRAEILVPLFASDQRMLGILAIGEKSSELPFDDPEKAMLMTIASACALTIENHHLRGRAPAVAAKSARASHLNPAVVCPACKRFYSPAAASRCPVDDSELEAADVPYVLVGKYRFEQRIGAGGMGVVYRARDLELERDVAIKTLPRLSAETASRLRREGRTAANLLHPNLATVFAVETWRGIPLLVLEYLDEGTLAERVSRGPLPIDSIVRCGEAIAEALGHVHARTILHRDVKPSNIGFARGGGAKLLDFGLARLLEERALPPDPATPHELTVTSGVVGTPAYLSPEAILGEPPHPDFDLWSLSLTLYEAATGSNPFLEQTVTATMNGILARSVPDPRELRSDCPEGLSRFLLDSLSRRREIRPRSAMELAARLRACVS